MVGFDIHVCGVTEHGTLRHTIRQGSRWTQFASAGLAGDRGRFVAVGCAVAGSDLHVCGVTDVGGLWHTIRRDSGQWTQFSDIELRAGDRGDFGRTGCAVLGGQLHVCGVSVEP